LADALVERVRALLPSYKCPSEFRVVDALPRTATGKVQRYKLRGQDSGVRIQGRNSSLNPES
jgi:2-aminobenzoate-CoA ligase